LLLAAGVLIAGFLVWYFSEIVLYVIGALVMSLIGRPVYDFLAGLKIRKFRLPPAACSLITLLVLIACVLSFFGLFIPLLVVKIQELSAIDPQSLVNAFREPLGWINDLVNRFVLSPDKSYTPDELGRKLLTEVNVGKVAGVFGSVANWVGNVSVALFSIFFMAFFFLKDEGLFSRALLSLIPDRHTQNTLHAMEATRRMLTRYFTGLLIEVSGVVLLSTIGLLIVGFSFRDALLVGFLAGIFNIIPYLGPVMGTVFGLFTGIVTYLGHPGGGSILLMAVWIIVVFMIVQFIDNMLIQPYVYSSSVNAHPLEIFIVFLVAGSVGGLAGMIFAVPAYTVLRVFAKEFFNQFKVVQSITRNI
jgi:predicted PurR-regulated permease PerM